MISQAVVRRVERELSQDLHMAEVGDLIADLIMGVRSRGSVARMAMRMRWQGWDAHAGLDSDDEGGWVPTTWILRGSCSPTPVEMVTMTVRVG